MSRLLEGHLILGWKVATDDIPTLYDEDGEWTDEFPNDVCDEVACILNSNMPYSRYPYGITDAYWQRSYDMNDEYTFIGVELMSDESANVRLSDFVDDLVHNADLYTDVANDVYETIMKRKPEFPPDVLCVPCTE